MSDELNFCPYCDSPQHKVVQIKENFFFCKSCNRFFNLNLIKLTCFKCGSDKIIDSDFPAPDGDLIFQCRSCKKMFPGREFFAKNKIEEDKKADQ